MTAAAILTGGLARRLHGRDKSALVIEGRSILERQLESVAPIAADILIVTSLARAADFPTARLPPRARVVFDHYPGTGPLGAVLTALEAAPGAAVFVLAADMPHVPAAFIAALIALHHRPGDPHATVPFSARGPEPLCAAYATGAAPVLRAAIGSGDLSLRRALARLRVREMPADEVAALGDPALIFRNINSPGDIGA